jgi:hypothetical protein
MEKTALIFNLSFCRNPNNENHRGKCKSQSYRDAMHIAIKCRTYNPPPSTSIHQSKSMHASMYVCQAREKEAGAAISMNNPAL